MLFLSTGPPAAPPKGELVCSEASDSVVVLVLFCATQNSENFLVLDASSSYI